MRLRFFWLDGALLALMISMSMVIAGRADAAQQAAIVMDMRNGQVLYADDADRRQHPASLTKMMTLYLAFEAVRDGRLGLDQKLRVSKHASRQPASKLYLKAGQRVAVRDLIRAAAIKSANDAAMVLAEGIGGSERAFGEMMTRRARQLGMKNSTFRNPHGLTTSGHLSTARDMAILARHLYFDFPQYYNIFGRTSDYAAGKRIWTTNRLLKSYRGADGLKTGYTRAAGYNLAATAHRGEKRIIAVLLGGRSSAQRNREVARLLDVGFGKAPNSTQAVKPRGPGRQLVAEAPLPLAKPGAPASGFAALADALVPIAEASTPPPPPPMSTSRFAPHIARPPMPRTGGGAAAVRFVRAKGGVPLPVPRPGGVAWAAQVGPYASETAALASLADIAASRVGGGAVSAFRVKQSGAAAYNLHLPGLTEGSAAQLCGMLSASNMRCDVVQAGR